jgi:hypothetical protein
MIKNLHLLLILGPKHDISKRHLKRCILTLFLRLFWPKITSKKFKSNIFRLNSTRAFDWCMNCHISLRKNFQIFFGKGPMKSIYLNKIAVNYVKFYFFTFLYPILYLIVQKFDSILILGLVSPQKKFGVIMMISIRIRIT